MPHSSYEDNQLDTAIQQVEDLIAQLEVTRSTQHPNKDLPSPARAPAKSSEPAAAGERHERLS